ncbi:unnamed protein product [Closterium sp. NIES-65]|nr:unnamed protein product [Closterium sp. NIES-65]
MATSTRPPEKSPSPSRPEEVGAAVSPPSRCTPLSLPILSASRSPAHPPTLSPFALPPPQHSPPLPFPLRIQSPLAGRRAFHGDSRPHVHPHAAVPGEAPSMATSALATQLLFCCRSAHSLLLARARRGPFHGNIRPRRQPPVRVGAVPGEAPSMATSALETTASLLKSFCQHVPGEAPSMATSALETTASLLQSFRPLKSFCQHVSTWAHYAQSPGRMIETHHLVVRLTEDVLQCIVFDSDQPNARIVGVEYIVTEAVFKKLPEEEKHLWHSHYYEICDGLWVNPGVPETMQQQELKKLICDGLWVNPGVPETMQQQELKKLIKTYGKFWNTWQFDRGDPLPLGPPALMLSPQDHPLGRVSRALVEQRDAALWIETGEKREQRAALVDKEWAATGKDRVADWWMESGKGWVTEMRAVELESMGMGKGGQETGGVPSVVMGGGGGVEGKKEGEKMGKERGMGVGEETGLAGRPAQSSVITLE